MAYPELDLTRRQLLKWSGAAGLTALATAGTQLLQPFTALAASKAKPVKPLPEPLATVPVKDFSILKYRVSGLSWNQLSQHVGLYEGYVKKLNVTSQALLAGGATDMRSLQQSHSYALNGALLHDWYFSNLGEDEPTIGAATKTLLERDFGSVEAYLADAAAVGKAMRGWVITGYSHVDKRVYNYGLDSHDVGMPTAFCPLVVLDVYEHAYMIDFGTNKAGYLAAFASHIRWGEVEKRLQHALALPDMSPTA